MSYRLEKPAAACPIETLCRLPGHCLSCPQVSVGASGGSPGGLHCSLQLSLDSRSLIVHRGQQPRPPPPAAGHRTILPTVAAASSSMDASGSSSGGGRRDLSVPSSSASEALASLASYLGLHTNARILLESINYRRVQLPAPADLEPVEGEPPGLALRRRHQARGRAGQPTGRVA